MISWCWLKWLKIVLNEFCIDIFVIKAAIKISRVPPYGGALGTQVDNVFLLWNLYIHYIMTVNSKIKNRKFIQNEKILFCLQLWLHLIVWQDYVWHYSYTYSISYYVVIDVTNVVISETTVVQLVTSVVTIMCISTFIQMAYLIKADVIYQPSK